MTVLDVAEAALQASRDRLGPGADRVTWLAQDLLSWRPPRTYDVWHDRAVFHFLTDSNDRAAYVRQVAHAVKSGGHVIVATFGPEGPAQCSGLDVVRYDADALHGEFGASFHLEEHLTELHRTPSGSIQQFIYCFCNVLPEHG